MGFPFIQATFMPPKTLGPSLHSMSWRWRRFQPEIQGITFFNPNPGLAKIANIIRKKLQGGVILDCVAYFSGKNNLTIPPKPATNGIIILSTFVIATSWCNAYSGAIGKESQT